MSLIKTTVPQTTVDSLDLADKFWNKLKNDLSGFTDLGNQTINIKHNSGTSSSATFQALKFPNFNFSLIRMVNSSNYPIYATFWISGKTGSNNFLDFIDHTTTPPSNLNGLNINGFTLKIPNAKGLGWSGYDFLYRDYYLYYLQDSNSLVNAYILIDPHSTTLSGNIYPYDYWTLFNSQGFRSMIILLWKPSSNSSIEYCLCLNDGATNFVFPRYFFYSFLLVKRDNSTSPPTINYYFNYDRLNTSIVQNSNYLNTYIKYGVLFGNSVSGSVVNLVVSNLKVFIPEENPNIIDLPTPPLFLYTLSYDEISNGLNVSIPNLGNYDFWKIRWGTYHKGHIYLGLKTI
ncbi:MAG: hypothetical protein ACPL1F_06950 [bacterium]